MICQSSFGDIYYEVTGPEGKPVVMFSHGVGMDHRTFADQVNALKEQYRVIVWDMPGHGRSTIVNSPISFSLMAADCLVEIMNETGTDRAVMVGLSLGSFVIQQVLARHPDRVAAMVHVGGTSLHPSLSKLLKPLFPVIVGLCRLLPKRTFYRTFAKHRTSTERARRYLEEVIASTGTELVLRITRDMGEALTRGVPEPPDRPTLIMYGEKDIYARRLSQRWHKRQPGSQLVVIPRAHHIANQDSPGEFNRVLMSFLEEIDTGNTR